MKIEKIQENSLAEIPIDGCLGVFALGDIGLLAWREKKANAINRKEKRKTKSDEA